MKESLLEFENGSEIPTQHHPSVLMQSIYTNEKKSDLRSQNSGQQYSHKYGLGIGNTVESGSTVVDISKRFRKTPQVDPISASDQVMIEWKNVEFFVPHRKGRG